MIVWANGFDLIDTLWNVKLFSRVKVNGTLDRFNRYIVECKGAVFAYLNWTI